MSRRPPPLAPIRLVLETVTTLSRALTSMRATPFGDAVLTRTQWDILFVLAHSRDLVAPGRLAEQLGITPGAVTQSVEQLRQTGLVDQSRSEKDGRMRKLQLTGTARAQVEMFETEMADRVAPWFDALDTEEIKQLGTLMSRVKDPR